MPAVIKERKHAKAAAKAADALGTSPKLAHAVVGTASVTAEPGRLSYQDGQMFVSTFFDDHRLTAVFLTCQNGPGKEVKMGLRDSGVWSNIYEGTFKNGTLEGPGTLTIDGPQVPKPSVRKGVFKNGKLEGFGTIDDTKVFFKQGDVVDCLTPGYFRDYFSGNKTKLLEHYMAITGTPPPAGGRLMKQMRRALIAEHYSVEHLRALGNSFFLEFQVEGWRDNASADPDALRAMLKSSAKIANLL